jgi:hypothetical protein
VHDRLIVYGGYAATALDEVWALSLDANTWRQLPSPGKTRWEHGATTDGARGWFFGGFTGDLASDFFAQSSLFELDLATDTWTERTDDGTRPEPTTSMALAVVDGALYTFGGHDERRVIPAMWRYDLTASRWKELAISGTPTATAHHGVSWDPLCQAMILVGGDHAYGAAPTPIDDGNDSAAVNFVHLTDTPSFVTLTVAGASPPGRRHAAVALDAETRTLVIYGGEAGPASNSPTKFGDTWLLNLPECP